MASAGAEPGTAAGGAMGARAVFGAAAEGMFTEGMEIAPVFSDDVPTDRTSLVVWYWQPARVARRPRDRRPAGKRMNTLYAKQDTGPAPPGFHDQTRRIC
jgi:hypothetical protein